MSSGQSVRGLRDLHLGSRYRSDRQDVVREFYVPALTVADRYSRAVGYFTSTSLALFSRGIGAFTERGGRIRLIASPYLDADDVEDIERGYDTREVLQRVVLRELDGQDSEGVLAGLGTLGRLIAQGVVDIKLAFVERDGRVGIYHEKLGLLRDGVGDIVAFTGSANETLGGLLANFESIDVFRGWLDGDSDRALRLEEDFEDLWCDRTANLSVLAFPDVAREKLIDLGRRHRVADLPAHDSALIPERVQVPDSARLEIPDGLIVRDYQREAVRAWLSQRGRGILKMATGTGKTKTALSAATQLAQVLRQREEALVVLVLAPFQHLVDQWITEVEEFGVRPVAVYESSQRWLPAVEDQLSQVRLGRRPVTAMVATNASFAGERFQAVLGRITQPLLVIADEAHNLGSLSYRSGLPAGATYRLALSATPERWMDDEGTAALTDYFGPVAYELGLGRAIEMGALCRYRYRPRIVELTDPETQLYVDLTTKIAKLVAAGDDVTAEDPASPMGHLLRKRTGVLGHAEGKIEQLRADLSARRHEWFQLVYCAEGQRPAAPGEPTGPNQVADVMDLLGNQLRLAAHPYVADTPRRQRRTLLRRFGSGEDLRVLVAMRCLDEGVDIPDARVGYILASSSNPRQFIQRRGRILRRAEGKDSAEIIDYLAVPSADAPVNFDVERRLLARELERANEFGKLADNYEETLEVLRPLKERYQLMHL